MNLFLPKKYITGRILFDVTQISEKFPSLINDNYLQKTKSGFLKLFRLFEKG